MKTDNEKLSFEDEGRFRRALALAASESAGGIGTMGEKGIHRTLKYFFEPHTDCHEVKIGGYIADAAGEGGIFEIQTAGFYRMKEKLTAFLAAAKVTVVYPVVSSKRIIKIDRETGEAVSVRRSPKKGSEWSIFPELYSIRALLCEPELCFRIVTLEADETRFAAQERGRGRRKGGASDTEKLPTRLVSIKCLDTPDDYAAFIPDGLGETFTVKEFAQAAKIDRDTARTALHVLSIKGLLKKENSGSRELKFSLK